MKYEGLVIKRNGVYYFVNLDNEKIPLEEWNKIKFEIDKTYYNGEEND